MELEKLP